MEEKKAHPRGWDFETLKKMKVTVWSYLEEYEKEKNDIISAVKNVFRSGSLILGPKVEEFEKEFSKYCESSFGVGVNSCTDALFLGLKSLDIGKGDEVITVSNTAVPTVAAIGATGATTKFVDINPETYLMDTTKIESQITDKTKCILVVHLYGQCVDMEKINQLSIKYNLKIVEDCAQSHGAKYNGKKAGSMSDVAAFSFYPTKVLGGYGDGGMAITKNSQIYKKIKSLRMYGMAGKYFSIDQGYNSRLDEIHAAILLTKLKRIDNYIDKRQSIAKKYEEILSSTTLILPKTAPNNFPVHYVYVVRHPQRDIIIEKLKEKGIFLNISYEWPIHTMDAYKYLGYKEGDLPQTEKACKEIFSLPIYPSLTEEKVLQVCNLIKETLKEIST
jgi:dTDP-3-amino-2,3,6-trideoxy-4-keto-D-glucose/dTDP-3-amino-3,4,6-trideoxy-alpha-D-glucose/dTDP-2,6-dideoxy-D-kanosamine transaminase